MKRAIRVVIYVALITIMPVGAFFILPAKVHYHVTEQYTFSTDQGGKKIRLAVMVPKDNAYQEIDNIEVKWDGDISREEYEEVDVIKLGGHSENEDAILEYDVTLFQGKIEWEAQAQAQDILPQKDIDLPNQY